MKPAATQQEEQRFQHARQKAVAAFENMPLLAAHDATTVATLARALPHAGIRLSAQQAAPMARAVSPQATGPLLTYDVRAMVDKREINLHDLDYDAEVEADLMDRHAPFENPAGLRTSLGKGRCRGRGRSS